jgi:hypothetical protein
LVLEVRSDLFAKAIIPVSGGNMMMMMMMLIIIITIITIIMPLLGTER